MQHMLYVKCQHLIGKGKVGDEEELDFHLEPTNDISWDDDNMSDQNPSLEAHKQRLLKAPKHFLLRRVNCFQDLHA